MRPYPSPHQIMVSVDVKHHVYLLTRTLRDGCFSLCLDGGCRPCGHGRFEGRRSLTPFVALVCDGSICACCVALGGSMADFNPVSGSVRDGSSCTCCVALGGSMADFHPVYGSVCDGSSCTCCVALGGSMADFNPVYGSVCDGSSCTGCVAPPLSGTSEKELPRKCRDRFFA